MSLLGFLHRLIEREDLSAADAEQAMGAILEGTVGAAQLAAFLVALRMKGETAEELLGFARAMRSRAVPVAVSGDGPLLDTCGTGGDGLATFNISTVAAFVVAGAGVRVAKHGNRSISSRCGSADVLEGLGVRLAASAEEMAESIRRVGVGFLFAPVLHPAMCFAQPVRQELKLRTVFNLLGPLTNPAGATHQLVGAHSARAAELLARTLAALGCEHGFVVHGADGLDEISTTAETLAWEIRPGEVRPHTLTPELFGVPRASLEQLRGGDREQNAEIARSILEGKKGPCRDIVLVNAAAALVAAGCAENFASAMALAAHSIDSGAALERLEMLKAFSRSAST